MSNAKTEKYRVLRNTIADLKVSITPPKDQLEFHMIKVLTDAQENIETSVALYQAGDEEGYRRSTASKECQCKYSAGDSPCPVHPLRTRQ